MFRKKFTALVMVFFLVASVFPFGFAEALEQSGYLGAPRTGAGSGGINDKSYALGYEPYNDRYYSYSGGSQGNYFGGSGYGAGYSSYQSRPSFQTYYGNQIDTYWPQLNNKETCEGRTDLLLNVAPIGCQPSVVRSDLLAEQNVPVFCQVDAFKINPLIDINSIKNIRFSGTYPPEVAGTGFHPARAALRTYDTLLGSPLVNNVGYVVVVLKKQPEEAKLPDFVEVNLSAKVDYVSGNAYGIGKTEFILQPTTSEEDWQSERLKQTFWNGRYSLRLEEANAEFADVSIYQGERRVSTARVAAGQSSNDIFVPGLYCRAGVQVAYDGLFSARDRARVEVSSPEGVDIFDVESGSSFLDGRCRVGNINAGSSGEIQLSCGGYRFDLALNSRTEGVLAGLPTPFCRSDDCELNLLGNKYGARAAVYYLREDNSTTKVLSVQGEEFVLVTSSGQVTDVVTSEDREWIVQLRNELIKFRERGGQVIERELGLSGEAKNYYDRAIELYEEVADEYPAEKPDNEMGANLFYGESALREAIELAEIAHDDFTKARLIEKLLDKYPENYEAEFLRAELSELGSIDSSEACAVVPFDERTYNVCLKRLVSAAQDTRAEFIVSGARVNLGVGEEARDIFTEEKSVGKIVLESVDFEKVEVNVFCSVNDRPDQGTGRRFILVRGGAEQNICGALVRLVDTDVKEVAKIRLIPKVDGTTTDASFSVRVGIEKREIQLSPDKALEKIDNLNESIEKWNELSDNLGNVVETMKGACFATAAALTFKNFLTGLSGETIARQQVMNGPNGWKSVCGSDDKCYLDNAAQINSDVARVNAALNNVNGKIKPIQDNFEKSDGIFGEYVNTDGFKEGLRQQAIDDYGDDTINTTDLKEGDWAGRDKVTVGEVLSNPKTFGVDDIKTIMLNAELQRGGGLSDGQKLNVENNLAGAAERINRNRIIEERLGEGDLLREQGFASATLVKKENQQTRVMNVIGLGEKARGTTKFGGEVTHTSTVIASGGASEKETGPGLDSGTYILGLKNAVPREGIYNVEDIYFKDDDRSLKEDEKLEFLRVYGIANIKSAEGALQGHEIVESDRVCKYYENEPYRGMPAVVPFDSRQGWYAATRQSLPVFGGIGAFDSSGRVTSFRLCNVGDNGRVEFESGLGDDLCQIINLNTGQPLGAFPGLEENEARALVSRAIKAIDDASRQYGNQNINVGGEICKVGKPSVGIPETQCQDFMSPEDCHLMFNVCDPVICPSSRCDFGGTFPVSNVAQTGIAGSALLCLPNIKEGIVVPVCLTGIKAGIDAWVSIMEDYRDCLQVNVDSGETIGICDVAHSVYLCEFFWGQVAPFVNVLVPKLIETAYGQGVRGGGEYLTVNAAWQNMQSSVDYFTQSYAVNSLEAFRARTGGQLSGGSISEIGGEFCKGFVSAKAPSKFESLIEADSPPQFHAWFDANRFSDATVPATAQYKVFYHIFAGDDQGVNFLVYLKDPPESSYYSSAPRITVDSGFIARGDSASETVDFTAPEGYKELCVRINEQEECGFKQVSTSFAVNYLRDEFVQNELERSSITSESACIGGTPTPGALLNPNLQSGTEEVIGPQVYNRGVVRICSTQNPGSQTDPGRFKDVGYCSDEKIKCWLDSKSVESALTNGGFSRNEGAVNETLENLRERTLNNFGGDLGFYTNSKEEEGEIIKLRDGLQKVKDSSEDLSGKVLRINELLGEADFVFDGLVHNDNKALLVLTKAEMNDFVARKYIDIGAPEKLTQGEIDVPVEGGSGTESRDGVIKEPQGEIIKISLGEADEEGITNLLIKDIESNYFIGVDNGKILYRNDAGEFIESGLIVFSQGAILRDGESVLEQGAEELLGGQIEGWSDRVSDTAKKFFCELKNPSWVDVNSILISEVQAGESVFLRVEGTEECKGRNIFFDFEEYDGMFFEGDNKTIFGPILFGESGGNYASVKWDSYWTDDVLGDPEFVFRARTEEAVSKLSNELKVKKNPEGEIKEENGNNEGEKVNENVYTLGAKEGKIEKILFDGEEFGIYIEDNARIYVEYEGGKEIMGVVVGNTGRLNIPLEERDILFLNEKLGEKARGVIEHLNFLNNKYYSALKEGIVKEE